MLEGLAGDSRVIIYLMTGIGVLGILAKIINQLTLYRLVRAAGNMPKSTHRLIKLVRAKYEHACMIHDSVENVDAFVEKYIYEYRGFLFRIHTWRQIEVLSVWFAGILAALGASVHYLSSGLTETVYQYIAAGIAEMVLLSVVMRLSDEPYKINAVKMYMVDYLENICAFRLKKQNQRERESIDVIAAENGGKNGFQPLPDARGQEEGTRKRVRTGRTAQAGAQSAAQAGSPAGAQQDAQSVIQSATQSSAQSEAQPEQAVYASHGSRGEAAGTVKAGGDQVSAAARGMREESLPINIEGEPRAAERSGLAGQALHSAENNTDSDRTALREEAIRQILEEFLA
ncbi:MAG TPA: hypothetical protein H9817_02960 [Candidatus Mediterraneibacter stercorigallinarum]|uniref:Uncharacterized protein n=1 Tax=Candidatus Mediterraneibacter stercorigallinarum TaxID=2838686 RepID=A0A9D2D9B1_9FIRM|nr:hypothetical protein [Candidatus Mediterraneibacter stercorigallinarum]